jgi:DHA1 family bicyclomycin/chloramphenicol resistance-like MFS transporter
MTASETEPATAEPTAVQGSGRLALPGAMLAVLGALSAFAPLSTDMYLPGLPAMARSLHTSASSAQLTLSSCLIGLAIGQLFAGPLSDALGRRRPLLLGLGAFIVASVLCELSPNFGVLLAMRFIQGLAGAAGIAIARAIVRDRTQGIAAARAYALLMVVTGLGPIVAPVAGGLLLHITDWRGIFAALAILGAVMLLTASVFVPETLAPAARHSGGLRTTRSALGVLVRDRYYLANIFAGALSAAALLAWIAASPFVLEHIHHLSPQLFSVAFAANGVGLLVARQIGARFIGRSGPAGVLRVGQLTQLAAAIWTLAFTLLDPSALAPLLVGVFVIVASVGVIMPMATALAMNEHRERAGSASGLLGFTQFTLGSLAAPLVGIAGAGSALPMALTMVAATLVAALATLAVRANGRSSGSAPAHR